MNKVVVLIFTHPMVIQNIFNIIQEGDIMENCLILRYHQGQMVL